MALVYFVFGKLQKLAEKTLFNGETFFDLPMKIRSLGHLSHAFCSFFVTNNHDFVVFQSDLYYLLKKCLALKCIFSASFWSLLKTKYTRTIYSSSSLHLSYSFHHSLRYFFWKIAKKASIIEML